MSESQEEDSWESKLKEEIAGYEDLYEHRIARVLERCLRAESSAAEAAKTIDKVYEDFRWADPLMKYEGDQVMKFFRWSFTDIVVDFASLIPHDNQQQDLLIQVLQELMGRPTIAERPEIVRIAHFS